MARKSDSSMASYTLFRLSLKSAGKGLKHTWDYSRHAPAARRPSGPARRPLSLGVAPPRPGLRLMGERGNGDPFAMKERLRPERPPAQGRDTGTPEQLSASGTELGTQGRVITHCSWSPPSRAPARRSSARHRPAPPAAAAERFRGRPARRTWARTWARAAAISYRGGALRAAPPCPPAGAAPPASNGACSSLACALSGPQQGCRGEGSLTPAAVLWWNVTDVGLALKARSTKLAAARRKAWDSA